jgi:very-short-patch-repair endonuclease
VITRRQLLALGYTKDWIKHAVNSKKLFPIHRGVYAVGRRELAPEGYFIAAVLACGESAFLSHESAAMLWGILKALRRTIEISVPLERNPRVKGLEVHRRTSLETTTRKGIPVTSPIQTLIDIAPCLDDSRLERAVNEAINRDLTDPEKLRNAVTTGRLCQLLDRDTFVLTDTELEQRLVPIARRAGLPKPQTQVVVNGHRVDFYFEELGIVVEADSLRFHRTAAQQRADILRDQAHFKAGLIPLRFTHWQITYDAGYVGATLSDVASARRTPRTPGSAPIAAAR